MAFKEITTVVRESGLYRVGYKYKSGFKDWALAAVNFFSRKRLRFDVKSDSRFSFSSYDVPFPLGKRERTLLVDLNSGEVLTLRASGDFNPLRIQFILDDPGFKT